MTAVFATAAAVLLSAVPALFIVMPLNFWASRLAVWLRALIAAVIPAYLFAYLWHGVASGEPPLSETKRLESTLIFACVQFGIGFIAAFLSARRYPVPE